MQRQESKPEEAAAPGFATSIAAAISSKPNAAKKWLEPNKTAASRTLLAIYWLGSMDLLQQRPRAGTPRPSAQLTGLRAADVSPGKLADDAGAGSGSPGNGREAARRVCVAWRGRPEQRAGEV